MYQLDPLEDPRWERLCREHPNASVFHTPAWLAALQHTYRYEPIVLTTSPPGKVLANGMVFCRIRSRLTGGRLVSLPFSDHCEPLVEDPEQLGHLLSSLNEDLRHDHSMYIEIRPMALAPEPSTGFLKVKEYWLHKIDLQQSLETLFSRLHTNVRRNVRRATMASLSFEDGRSGPVLQDFYTLLTLTRRRKQLPPQPFRWFSSLLECMREKANVRVVYKDSIPVAGILTLRHRDVLIYKYGCFDYRYRQLGGMAGLLWRTIEQAQQNGVLEFDLGRSDFEDVGLITFKDRWASTRSRLTYWRCGTSRFDGAAVQWTARFGRRVFSHMPQRILTAAGNCLYRHVG